MPPKKRRAVAAKKPVSPKTREADERLRESLRNADMTAFDRALKKAIKAPRGA